MYDELSGAFVHIAHKPKNLTKPCTEKFRNFDPANLKEFDEMLDSGADKYPFVRLTNYPKSVRTYTKIYGAIKQQFRFKPE